MKQDNMNKGPQGLWQYDEEDERLYFEFAGIHFSLSKTDTDVKDLQIIIIEKLLQKLDVDVPEEKEKLMNLWAINNLLLTIYDNYKLEDEDEMPAIIYAVDGSEEFYLSEEYQKRLEEFKDAYSLQTAH